MAKLANIQDKRGFKRAQKHVDLNLQLFKDMKSDVEETADLTGEADR